MCRAAAAGQDLLLVMPTGAGKSLCFQLPGLARPGTTLVISPLIALMEDQAASLTRRGFRVGALHGGKERTEARQICLDYLSGRLEFLLISPERLAFPGVLTMLAKRPISLIAVDEAHCISQWGHDFRPDYRLLGERLSSLRPAPVLAVTATATPRVQQDIMHQLRMVNPGLFAHGFRRANLGIEVCKVPHSERLAEVRRALRARINRPAIVYVPTRKEAVEVSDFLNQSGILADAYHAGFGAPERQRVQQRFLTQEIEVIAATVAFGMGIDKPNIRSVIHTALPGSLESYYQEIGRAGRDDLPSRALLLYSTGDLPMHEFFHRRDYPELPLLRQLYTQLNRWPDIEELAPLATRLRCSPEVIATVLQKLRSQGLNPAIKTQDPPQWEQHYSRQKEFHRNQVRQVEQFIQHSGCRMSALVAYFGQTQGASPCGQCDRCVPNRRPLPASEGHVVGPHRKKRSSTARRYTLH